MKPSFVGIDELDVPQRYSSEYDNPDFLTKYQIVARVVDGSDEHSVWRHARNYLTCFISIRDCRIRSCFAKGWGQSGDGGAVLALNSQLKIENNIFEYNEANTGGSIAAYNSNVLITRTTFQNDIGYLSGGSLYVAGNLNYNSEETQENYIPFNHPDKPSVDSTVAPLFCQVHHSSFYSCSSFELFGAVFINSVPEVYFRDVTFKECYAGSCGGAVGISDSTVYFYECDFTHNHCGKESSALVTESYGMIKVPSAHYVRSARGGGAIFFSALHQPENYWELVPLLELVTQNCKFTCNYVEDKLHPHSSQQQPGFDILFYNYSIYRSYFDTFTWPKHLSIAISPFESDTEILQFSQYENIDIGSASCNNVDQLWTIVETAYDTQTTKLQTDTNVIDTPQENVYAYPATQIPPHTTRSPFAHSNPSVLTKAHSRMLQSPSATVSRSPTCSTFGEVPPPDTRRTTIVALTPSYYWEVTATPHPSRTKYGDKWPEQTTHLSPTKSLPGYLPDCNVPTQSWWGEVPNPLPTVSVSFFGEPSQSRGPNPFPTNLGTAEFGRSYKTMTITNSKTLTLTFWTTLMFSYAEQPVQVQSCVVTEEDGVRKCNHVLVETLAVPYDGLVSSPIVLTALYISYEFSSLTPTQTTDKYEVFVENPTKTQTVTYYQSPTYTVVFSMAETLMSTQVAIDTSCVDGHPDQCETIYSNSYFLSEVRLSTAASIYVFMPSETVLDVIQLSRKQKRAPRTPVDSGVILGVAVALTALIFGVSVGVLLMKRRMMKEAMRLAEEMGEQFDFSGASEQEIMDENDGVTATIDVPSEDLNQTFDEADNWI